MTTNTFDPLAQTLTGAKLLYECLMAAPVINHSDERIVIQVIHQLIIDPIWYPRAIELLKKFEHDEIAGHVLEILETKEHLLPQSTKEHLLDLMRERRKPSNAANRLTLA